jgi:hypothetical protein
VTAALQHSGLAGLIAKYRARAGDEEFFSLCLPDRDQADVATLRKEVEDLFESEPLLRSIVVYLRAAPQDNPPIVFIPRTVVADWLLAVMLRIVKQAVFEPEPTTI